MFLFCINVESHGLEIIVLYDCNVEIHHCCESFILLIFRDSCWYFAKNDVNLLLFCVHFCFTFAMFPVYVCKDTQCFAKSRNIS